MLRQEGSSFFFHPSRFFFSRNLHAGNLKYFLNFPFKPINSIYPAPAKIFFFPFLQWHILDPWFVSFSLTKSVITELSCRIFVPILCKHLEQITTEIPGNIYHPWTLSLCSCYDCNYQYKTNGQKYKNEERNPDSECVSDFTLRALWASMLHNLAEPQFAHLQTGTNNSLYIVGLLWEINERMWLPQVAVAGP